MATPNHSADASDLGARTSSIRFPRLGVWPLLTFVVAVLLVTPLFAVLGISFENTGETWSHLRETVLSQYLTQTLYLAIGVSAGTLVIGVGTAWLVTMFTFPGRGTLCWALLLPLAMPTYIAAYAYTDLLEYAGPLQTSLRTLFGWQSPRDYWFPEVRSLGGAILFMTLVLYPYVYLLARSAFLQQASTLWEAARGLGHGSWSCFLRIGLPLGRPAIAAGVLLALMETLNDFGTVDYFAVPTLTVGVYRVWFGMNNAAAAAQLASMLLVLVLILVASERLARGRKRFQFNHAAVMHEPATQLGGRQACLAAFLCGGPIVLGFVIPASLMVSYTVDTYESVADLKFLTLVFNSLTVSILGAAVCVLLGLFLAYGVRVSGTAILRLATRVASSGYTVPGAVLAVGVLIPATALDNRINNFSEAYLGIHTGLLVSGTLYALIFAYVVRFLALSFGSLEAGLTKITTSMDDAARSLGHRPLSVLTRVHLPLLRGSLLTGAMLVFVDCMKELPMTLILRPFNFNTVATHVYEYASYEAFEEAAPAAIAVVLVGLAPVIGLSIGIAGSTKSSRPHDR
jgi:iron(III) transport system permease protein